MFDNACLDFRFHIFPAASRAKLLASVAASNSGSNFTTGFIKAYLSSQISRIKLIGVHPNHLESSSRGAFAKQVDHQDHSVVVFGDES